MRFRITPSTAHSVHSVYTSFSLKITSINLTAIPGRLVGPDEISLISIITRMHVVRGPRDFRTHKRLFLTADNSIYCTGCSA